MWSTGLDMVLGTAAGAADAQHTEEQQLFSADHALALAGVCGACPTGGSELKSRILLLLASALKLLRASLEVTGPAQHLAGKEDKPVPSSRERRSSKARLAGLRSE
ncbi:hypothetical protein NDU88_002098 [Pleurodeles waltl]|uniref:Uncharacterized protein n=1 Tax=Pleurodeles waltl TaxID=8319 RepID=A0AAV7LDB4_PLEWA|nr:hypothetical protein NDU88_002098 [Pleurodeles waltl]